MATARTVVVRTTVIASLGCMLVFIAGYLSGTEAGPAAWMPPVSAIVWTIFTVTFVHLGLRRLAVHLPSEVAV